jgi:hypothetical protein
MAIKISGTTIIDDNRNVNVGIVTAEQFSGSGDNLVFSPTITSFSPTDGATDVIINTNIVLTFDQPIYAGVGSIFLRNSSGIGTIIEAISIGSTSNITINNQTLTIDPTSLLPISTDVYVVLPRGVIKNSIGGFASSLTTYNFTSSSFAFSSINPTNGATNIGVNTSITLTFTSPPIRGTGTIELKSGSSTTGTLIESFNAASSGRISIVGNNWILTPTSNLGFTTSIWPIIPSTAITAYAGLNTTGANTYSFTSGNPQLGSLYAGGYLICLSGGVRWLVAPASSEVSRNWYSVNDANTRAQSVSGCTGWFVPGSSVLRNPGYSCRSYWDSYCVSAYWTGSSANIYDGYYVSMSNGSPGGANKNTTLCVRSFRCVTY